METLNTLYGAILKSDIDVNFIKIFNIVESDKWTCAETNYGDITITCFFKAQYTPNFKEHLGQFIRLRDEDRVFYNRGNKTIFWLKDDNFEQDFRALTNHL